MIIGEYSPRQSRGEYFLKITEPEALVIVLVFLHIQVNMRNNCPSLYTKVIFLREIICSRKMLFILRMKCIENIYTENEIYTLKKFYSKLGLLCFLELNLI